MKKLSILIVLTVFLLSACTSADELSGRAESVITFQTESNFIIYSDGEKVEIDEGYIPIYIDGKIIKNASMIIKNNISLIPLKVVSEEVGINVVWDDKKNEVTIDDDGKIIKLMIGKNTIIVNEEEKHMDLESTIIDGLVYLPLGFISEYLDRTVECFNPNIHGENNSIINTRTVVYIDEKYENDTIILKEKALESAKSLCFEGLENYKISLKDNLKSNGEDPDRFNKDIELIKKSINEMEYEGEISRYYIFDMYAYRVVVDKINGEVYFNYNMGLATYTVKVDVNNPGLYTPLFIIG